MEERSKVLEVELQNKEVTWGRRNWGEGGVRTLGELNLGGVLHMSGLCGSHGVSAFSGGRAPSETDPRCHWSMHLAQSHGVGGVRPDEKRPKSGPWAAQCSVLQC